MLSAGKTREEIIESAQEAVRLKRKNWKIISARLDFMTYEMPDHITVLTVSGHLVHNCGYGGGVGALKAMGAKMPRRKCNRSWIRGAQPIRTSCSSGTRLGMQPRK